MTEEAASEPRDPSARDTGIALTTTQSIESGNTVVQKVNPTTGEVTQTSVTEPAPTLEADLAKDAAIAETGAIAVGKVIETDVSEGVTALSATSADPLAAPKGQVDKGVALQRARVSSSTLNAMLHNVASHIDLDIKELSATVENLLAALRHLV